MSGRKEMERTKRGILSLQTAVGSRTTITWGKSYRIRAPNCLIAIVAQTARKADDTHQMPDAPERKPVVTRLIAVAGREPLIHKAAP